LAERSGVRLIGLQHGEGREQLDELGGRFPVEVLDFPLEGAPGDFLDTAAIMHHLDLVVTSDSAVAHLAGGLGVRTWVALQFTADWRWGKDGPRTPWYPALRLFRQSQAGDWDGVFRRMAEALRDVAG
jgi:ADP-heptose:LPS heptosyltransferase